MAEEELQKFEDALNTIASLTEQSTKMKKELKQTIYDTLSTLRKLFVKLKEVSDSKTRKITELQTLVSTTKAQLAVARDSPAYAEAAKQHKVGNDHGKLYSEALRGKVRHTTNSLSHLKKVNLLTQSKKY